MAKAKKAPVPTGPRVRVVYGMIPSPQGLHCKETRIVYDFRCDYPEEAEFRIFVDGTPEADAFRALCEGHYGGKPRSDNFPVVGLFSPDGTRILRAWKAPNRNQLTWGMTVKDWKIARSASATQSTETYPVSETDRQKSDAVVAQLS